MENQVIKPFLRKIKVVSLENVNLGEMGLFMFIDQNDLKCTLELLKENYEDDNPGVQFRLIPVEVEMGFSSYAHDVINQGVLSMRWQLI
tara:strand:+ start:305 stop:571 length:267 start_codon:yes stop_codon:yes gene_type:complete